MAQVVPYKRGYTATSSLETFLQGSDLSLQLDGARLTVDTQVLLRAKRAWARGQIIPHTCFPPEYLEAVPRYREEMRVIPLLSLKAPTARAQHPCFHFCGLLTRNYQHYLVELLPAINHYFKLKKICPELKLLVEPRCSWQQEFLYLLGVSPLDIEYYAEWKEIPRLISAPVENINFRVQFTPGLISVFRQIRDHFASLSPEPHQVYLDRVDHYRQNSSQRRILLNKAELLARIQPLGFEVFSCEGKNLSQKLSRLNRAQTVVTVEGANIMNLCFAHGLQHLVILDHPLQHGSEFFRALLHAVHGPHIRVDIIKGHGAQGFNTEHSGDNSPFSVHVDSVLAALEGCTPELFAPHEDDLPNLS